ncbi:MAG: hypothetical protein AAB421_04170 [Patescibacteria group bacterium]
MAETGSGGGGGDLVSFLIGLVIIGALVQQASVQIAKLTGTTPPEEIVQVAPMPPPQTPTTIPYATTTQQFAPSEQTDDSFGDTWNPVNEQTAPDTPSEQ